MAAREQYKWGILQIYKDDVGVCGFESLHGVGKHFLGIRRNAAPDRIVASKLPDHEIGFVTQDIVVKAGDVVWDVLHDAPAIDQFDPCGGPPSGLIPLSSRGAQRVRSERQNL